MSNGYMVFLKYCLLPVTPSKITTKINNANKTITLIDEGQVNLLKKAELTDVEFECMIPQTNYPFALYKSGFLGASFFLAYFERLKTSKKPFQFIIVRMKPNGRILFSTNLKVTLEDYTIVEDAGQGLDLTVKINLKQWRDYRTKLVNIQQMMIPRSRPRYRLHGRQKPPHAYRWTDLHCKIRRFSLRHCKEVLR